MDLDQILYGLESFVFECEEKKLRTDTVFSESYRTLLDQLAVKLRDAKIRDEPLIRDNLAKFVNAADYLVTEIENEGFDELLSELVRVLANAVADNDTNRRIIAQNNRFINHVGTQLQKNFYHEDVNQRLLILLKNLVIDTPELSKRISYITNNLFAFLGYEDSFMAIDLLNDLIEFQNYKADIKVVKLFVEKIKKFVAEQAKFDEDEFSELIVNSSHLLEKLTFDSRLSFEECYEISTQKGLISLLILVEPLEFRNKLMAQRRLFASIGNISSNPSSSNKILLQYTAEIAFNKDNNNGYVCSAAFIIIGNSIASPLDRDHVLDRYPGIIKKVLAKYDYLVDPVQFQGILHILKMLISFDNIIDFFQEDTFKIFELLIEATIRNSRYYTNFTQLLTAFLKKFIVLLGKSQVEKIANGSIPSSLLSSESNYETNQILLLFINKIAVYKESKSNHLLDLTTRVFTFTNPSILTNYVFELTKTTGILLQNRPEFMLEHLVEGLLTLLSTCETIISQSSDNAANAVHNNARYVAGSLVNLSQNGASIPDELLRLSKKLLNT